MRPHAMAFDTGCEAAYNPIAMHNTFWRIGNDCPFTKAAL